MSETADPGPSLVIVTHQTRDEVLGCLASVAGEPLSQVVVVDTGSTDGTAQAVRELYPAAIVLELANAGFGRAANTGFRRCDSPFVIVANADVRFMPGSIARLVRELQDDPSLAIAGPAVFYPDGRPQASARRIPGVPTAVAHAMFGRVWPNNPWTRHYRAADARTTTSWDADWLSGCALCVRRVAFESIDGFDPGFHLYMEDVDLGVRLREGGWTLRYLPDAVVEHRVGASTSAQRHRALLAHARSIDRYCRRHYVGPVARCLRPAVRVGLGLWVAATWTFSWIAGSRRSTTGERTDVLHP